MLQKRPVFGRGVFYLPAPCTQRVGFTQKNRLETVQAEGEGGKSLKKSKEREELARGLFSSAVLVV